MDGASAAAIAEDDAENNPLRGQWAPERSVGPSAEDTINDRVGVFCCQDCGETFGEEAAYSEHRRQHLQEMDGLHDSEKDNKAANTCTICSLSFAEESEFHLHMEKNHGEQNSQKKSDVQTNSGLKKQQNYECEDCGKSYVMIGHFLNHQRSHRQASKSLLHDLEHLKKKAFQCESCGRNYSRASALDAHRRCHEEKLVKSRNKNSGESLHHEESTVDAKPQESRAEEAPEKLFVCTCGKAFAALYRMKAHQRFSRKSQCTPVEVKEKPKQNPEGEFHCSECKKSFNGHVALFNHQRWHTNHSKDSAKRFPCEECGKEFMTLSFYYRHQRMAHSDETPAKSFLHQVCQLQKKAFECKDCGLKFSRESALHSHELHHTDVFVETEKEVQTHPSSSTPLPQQKSPKRERKETVNWVVNVESERLLLTGVTKEDSQKDETDEDMDSYEPGDFNVQVISASESEDESFREPNPDLELLCESDLEVRDDGGDTGASPGGLVSKSGMDLKIVQVDFEQPDELIEKEAGNEAAQERFDCPECYRWFSRPTSLRVHRMWHRVHRKRRQTQGQSAAACTSDTCGHDGGSCAEHCSHTQHTTPDTSSNVMYQAEGLEKNNLTCSECGESFSHLSALVSHQLHHPKRKRFQCPDCMMSYLHAASLFNHMKNCSAQKKENISDAKKEYNPKKTLLGPKIYHCEQCRKGFWSLGAYSHHKQNQTECAQSRQRKGVGGSLTSVNGRARSGVKVACPVCGRKFRHKGIMALHMRKHENGDHKCELCDRSFRLFSSLLRHQVVHSDQLLPPPIKSFQHQVEQLKKNTYSCPDCGKLFSRAKALQFHMKSHGYETGHDPSSPRSTVTLEDRQCATCLAHFNNKASLRAHQKLCINRENRAVDCKMEPVENSKTLEFHKDSEDVGAQKSAELFVLNAEVKNEMGGGEIKMEEQSGTSDLKYKCDRCDRRFSVVGALNLHKRVHAQGYGSEAKAKVAISVVRKKPKQEEPSKGLFHCSDCGRRFMSNSALGTHRRWHKGNKCSRASLKDDDLKSVGYKTEDGHFQCNNCGKQFFNRCVLQRHQMFNPQCQTKTEPEADSSKNAEKSSSSSTDNPACSRPESKDTLVQDSLLAKICEAAGREGDGLVFVDHVPEQADVRLSGSQLASSTPKGKAHRCSLCSMTFAKARGLRAHKWQAHSKGTKGKHKVPLRTHQESNAARHAEDSSSLSNATVMSGFLKTKTKSPVGRGRKKIVSTSPPGKSVMCLDCGKHCTSTDALLHHKKLCMEVKQESKPEVQTPEATAEVSPPPGRLLEHSVKCLFKCDKCGKAFQTEEQLGTHKNRTKSRPYSCALCCQGFWAEAQLQQHLAWHDEVRCRLPNELRYRLSAAMTSKPVKPNRPLPSSPLNGPTVKPDGQSQSSHKCQHCGKAFLSPTALQKHETQHCNNDSYHCSICPRTFSEIQDLIDHHQECIDKQCIIKCKECGLRFTHWEVFKTHLHQHSLEDEEVEEEEEVVEGDKAEEAEAQVGDETCPEGEDEGENEDEDMDDGTDWCESLSTTEPFYFSESAEVAAIKKKLRKVYACLICGKVYTYLVSFKKHQEQHDQTSFPPEGEGVPNLHKYACPYCGMSFIRRTRLIGHLRVHMASRAKPPRCDQCNKDFTSMKSWMIHADRHREKPFWCLSCAKGFADEASLDKHLQRHSLRPHRGNIVTHQKKHVRAFVGSSGRPLGLKNAMNLKRRLKMKKRRLALTSVKEEDLPEKKESVQGDENENQSEHNELGGREISDDSDCGEPSHRVSDPAGSDPPDQSRSETAGQERDEGESWETKGHREHKYWEWECFECDMGFDDVAKLHLHYIKHATGEIPFPQAEAEG